LASVIVVVTAPSEAMVTVVVSPVGVDAADDKAVPADDSEAVSVVKGDAAVADAPDDPAAAEEAAAVSAFVSARIVERLLNAFTLIALAPDLC